VLQTYVWLDFSATSPHDIELGLVIELVK